jgi:membrane protease YdiL (CAAX protease family)
MIYLPPMDTPPPDDVPPEPPILLPAADLPPLGEPLVDAVPVLIPAGQPRQNRWIKPFAFAALGAGIAGSLWLIGGEARLFLICGVIVPPMVVLPLLAYVGEREPAARIVTLIYWFILVGMAAVGIFGMAASAALGPQAFAAVQDHRPAAEIARLMPAGALTKIVFVAAGIAAGVILGAACFAPHVRAVAARLLPLDRRSFVHATALASVVGLATICFVPVIVLGVPPALSEGATGKSTQELQQLPPDLILRLTCYLYFWVIGSFLCFVGFPLARSLRGALIRLGLVVPSPWQLIGALAGAAVLIVVMAGVDYCIAWVWDAMGWPRTDSKKFGELMTYAISPIGAVVVGVSAGLSEELFFRGILQPRLGLLVSNLSFTAMHALQYNFDALASVFLVGLILGLIRRHTNTTTSVVVHGTYDFLAILLTYLQVPGFM